MSRNQTIARLGLGGVVPLLVSAVTIGSYLFYRGDLPSRLASHYDAGGNADDSMTHLGFGLAIGTLVVIGLSLCIGVAVYRKPLPNVIGPIVGFLGGFLAGIGSAIFLQTVLSHRNIENWEDVENPGWVTLIVITVAILVGTICARLAVKFAETDEVASQDPVMNLKDYEHALWTSTIKIRWALFLGVGLILIGVCLGVFVSWVNGISLLLSGFLVLLLSHIRVRASRRGLTLNFGLLDWPRMTIKTEQIINASAIDVKPSEWGGWGYRGSLKFANHAALVHRKGPGLRLDLKKKKIFVLTVDDPKTPASILNAEVARSTDS